MLTRPGFGIKPANVITRKTRSAIAAASLFSAVTAFAGPIEIPNPGFERGLDGWKNSGDNGMSHPEADAAFEGKLGLRVVDNDANQDSRIASQNIPVTPGKTYRVKFHARNLDGRGVNVFLYFYNSAGERLSLEGGHSIHREIPEGESEWKEYSVEAKAFEDAKELQFVIRSNKRAIVKADFDAFSVEELD